MRILMLGVNHRSATLDQREQLALSGAELETFVQAFREQYQVQDRGDLLAMTALQLASRPHEPQVAAPAGISEENERRLNDLLARMDAALSGS